jgi:hypothetical protein
MKSKTKSNKKMPKIIARIVVNKHNICEAAVLFGNESYIAMCKKAEFGICDKHFSAHSITVNIVDKKSVQSVHEINNFGSTKLPLTIKNRICF